MVEVVNTFVNTLQKVIRGSVVVHVYVSAGITYFVLVFNQARLSLSHSSVCVYILNKNNT